MISLFMKSEEKKPENEIPALTPLSLLPALLQQEQ